MQCNEVPNAERSLTIRLQLVVHKIKGDLDSVAYIVWRPIEFGLRGKPTVPLSSPFDDQQLPILDHRCGGCFGI